jgi:hypothetical protein
MRQVTPSSYFLGSFWGISEGERGRPTADIGGNFDGGEEAPSSTNLAGKLLDPTFIAAPPAASPHSS